MSLGNMRCAPAGGNRKKRLRLGLAELTLIALDSVKAVIHILPEKVDVVVQLLTCDR